MRAVFIVALSTVAACAGQAKESPTTATASPAKGAQAAEERGGRELSVDGIEPNKGDIDGDTYVLIKGNRFIADGPRRVDVYFGSRKGTVVRFASDKELIVQAPGGKAGEIVDVLVVFEPGGELRLPRAFTFVDKSAPPP